ncbi:MAG: cyclic nucleotide-binding domain-containing protein [Acidobacteria bacterium]|nr:cyclic nucleotide-binding domain-containing protein [Acidobacteriota bacterium]
MAQSTTQQDDRYALSDGSRVAVVGGGPAGALFSYFLLQMAERAGRTVALDVYEPKDFLNLGPGGCNMCGGIISESLVQMLATEGINLPPGIVQRGIDSYVLHTDVGTVKLNPPGHERRIAAVHRGGGPRGSKRRNWGSFDAHLLKLAVDQGAKLVPERVEDLAWEDGRPRVVTKKGSSEAYDLAVLAIGVNNASMKLVDKLGLARTAPKTTKTFICEIELGTETIDACMGGSMHVFLLNLPRLEFAALIPKGDYVTLVLLGEAVDKELVAAFLGASEVKACFPAGWQLSEDYCRCFPSINVRGSTKPFADRLVMIGDAGESRLYKDGIGGAYRTAKAAAKTAVFEGVSEEDFRRHYFPACKSLGRDNQIGRLVFLATKVIQKLRFARRGMLSMAAREQADESRAQRLSGVLWDTFTGSAPYRDVFRRSVHPLFLSGMLFEIVRASIGKPVWDSTGGNEVIVSELGKMFHDGDVIIRQGEAGDCMYVIQSGRVAVVREEGGQDVPLTELAEGDFFGEMALFEKDVRSATVRAIGDVRILTVDKKIFLRKIHEDPSMAFRVMTKMSRRIRTLDDELARATAAH